MATSKSGISIEDYLRTSYPDGDREYVDGEVISRPMPPFSHGELQALLSAIFHEFKRKGAPFSIAVEVRSRTSPSTVRLPDVSVYVGRPTEEAPSEPPFVIVEILSPDDRMSAVMEKLREYRTWGAPHIWLIDPEGSSLAEFVSQGLIDVHEFVLSEFGLTIRHDDIFPPQQ
jgi:Uma2 family endonuclease